MVHAGRKDATCQGFRPLKGRDIYPLPPPHPVHCNDSLNEKTGFLLHLYYLMRFACRDLADTAINECPFRNQEPDQKYEHLG